MLAIFHVSLEERWRGTQPLGRLPLILASCVLIFIYTLLTLTVITSMMPWKWGCVPRLAYKTHCNICLCSFGLFALEEASYYLKNIHCTLEGNSCAQEVKSLSTLLAMWLHNVGSVPSSLSVAFRLLWVGRHPILPGMRYSQTRTTELSCI